MAVLGWRQARCFCLVTLCEDLQGPEVQQAGGLLASADGLLRPDSSLLQHLQDVLAALQNT